MGRINLGRVVLGGIVAGLVINIVEGIVNGAVMATQWAATMTSLNRSPVMSIKQIVAFNLWGFAVGILTVWVYAAIRPRFGAGPKTAMCAGLFVWATAFALGNAAPVFLHIFRVDYTLTVTGIEFLEMLAASVAGCYFYKEQQVDQPKVSAARA
jgi:hypothetical protein